jgi:hypothetical protein
MGLPLWAVALVVAAAAPFVVSYVADVMEARVRKRTEEALAAARRSKQPTSSHDRHDA